MIKTYRRPFDITGQTGWIRGAPSFRIVARNASPTPNWKRRFSPILARFGSTTAKSSHESIRSSPFKRATSRQAPVCGGHRRFTQYRPDQHKNKVCRVFGARRFCARSVAQSWDVVAGQLTVSDALHGPAAPLMKPPKAQNAHRGEGLPVPPPQLYRGRGYLSATGIHQKQVTKGTCRMRRTRPTSRSLSHFAHIRTERTVTPDTIKVLATIPQ